jgi:hypothetical protein
VTDKEYRVEKKRVQKYINKWFQAMGLGWFRVDMVWERERDLEVPDTAAKTLTKWQYRTANITWFLPATKDCNDEFLENVVVHEFVHILVAPMANDDEPNEHEYATESLARAMQWVREAGQKGIKRNEP